MGRLLAVPALVVLLIVSAYMIPLGAGERLGLNRLPDAFTTFRTAWRNSKRCRSATRPGSRRSWTRLRRRAAKD